MKKSEATFVELCDLLVVQPYYTSAANILGIDPKTILRWIHASQLKPKDYTFVWCEHEAPLHEHVRSAMRMNAHMIESQARKLALDGFDEVVVFQGQIQYVEDESKVGMDLDTCELIDGYRDHWKRDAAGHRIPLTVRRKPSDALILKVLAAAFPKVYGDHSSVDVKHAGTVKLISPYARDVKRVSEKVIDADFQEVTPQIEHKPEPASAEDRLAAIRERMRIEAEAHLARPGRQTVPQGVVQRFEAGDTEINDAKKFAGRQHYNTAPARAGGGTERTGVGPDPRNPDGRGIGFKRA